MQTLLRILTYVFLLLAVVAVALLLLRPYDRRMLIGVCAVALSVRGVYYIIKIFTRNSNR